MVTGTLLAVVNSVLEGIRLIAKGLLYESSEDNGDVDYGYG